MVLQLFSVTISSLGVSIYFTGGDVKFISPVERRPFVSWLMVMYTHLQPLREHTTDQEDYYY